MTTVLNPQDLSKNFLSPVNFVFKIKKLPEFNFFVQSIVLPGIEGPSASIPTPFKVIPLPGDHPTYGQIQVEFKVNEDLGNYIEVHNWIRFNTFPESFEEHKNVADQEKFTGESILSDATLTILGSSKTPMMNVEIKDLFPVGISGFTMDTKMTSVDYVTATVMFEFRDYSFKAIT